MVLGSFNASTARQNKRRTTLRIWVQALLERRNREPEGLKGEESKKRKGKEAKSLHIANEDRDERDVDEEIDRAIVKVKGEGRKRNGVQNGIIKNEKRNDYILYG